MATSRICSIPGCGKKAHARDYCCSHYHRWCRYGSPTGGGTPRGKPKEFLVEVALTYDGPDCLIWPFARTPAGYGSIQYEGRNYYVHRLVCERTHGKAPSHKHEAAHSCGNGNLGCCSPSHLRWATHAENMADMVDHQRSPKGSRQGQSKLTKEDVQLVRSLKGEATHQEIATMLGVSRSHIGRILNRGAWSWL